MRDGVRPAKGLARRTVARTAIPRAVGTTTGGGRRGMRDTATPRAVATTRAALHHPGLWKNWPICSRPSATPTAGGIRHI